MLARTPPIRKFERAGSRMEIRSSSRDGSVELLVLESAAFPERRLRLSRELAAELAAILLQITGAKT
jgi:hypothetical protein